MSDDGIESMFAQLNANTPCGYKENETVFSVGDRVVLGLLARAKWPSHELRYGAVREIRPDRWMNILVDGMDPQTKSWIHADHHHGVHKDSGRTAP